MNKTYYLLMLFSLTLAACDKQKEDSNPELLAPPKSEASASPLVDEWRLVKLEENGYEARIENCSRKSSLVFGTDQIATRTTYQYTLNTDPNDAKDTCNYVTEAKAYSTILQQSVLQSIGEAIDTEAYTYSVTIDTLVMTYINGAEGMQKATYRKNYQYDLAKEVIGTWYAYSLRRNDIYDYNKDLIDSSGYRSQQKVVITKNPITMHQYRYTKNKCREIAYKGAYEIPAGLGVIKVRSKIRGKVNIGLREFRLDNDTLEF